MRRLVAFTILGSTLAAVIIQPAAATKRTPRTSITLHLRSQLLHVAAVDNAPAGRSAGDELIFTERLLDERGRQVGSDAASCVALFHQRSLCAGAYILHGGEITVQLVQPNLSGARKYDQAITGGTGIYARATGTVTVDQRPSGDRFTLHIHLPAA